MHGVVRGSAAGKSLVADQSGKTEPPGVHAEFLVVIVAEELHGYLGHAVDGRGALDGVLRGVLCGGRGSEGRN